MLCSRLPLDDDQAGWPYGSLVQTACSPEGAPILLLSKLAVHTRNLMADGRASLLFQDRARDKPPLASARLSLLGQVSPSRTNQLAMDRARYLARYPEAAEYVDFADFGFYRMQAERGHLVAGFGKIEWLPEPKLQLRGEDCAWLQDAEAGILAHMNHDHAEVVRLYAEKLLNLAPGSWIICGCDPEGADLSCERGTGVRQYARLGFAGIVASPSQIRAEFVRLGQLARIKS